MSKETIDEQQYYKDVTDQYKKFNIELGDFLQKPAMEIYPEALIMSLLSAARVTACAYFERYEYLLGFLTNHLTKELKPLHEEIQKIIKIKREEKNEPNTL